MPSGNKITYIIHSHIKSFTHPLIPVQGTVLTVGIMEVSKTYCVLFLTGLMFWGDTGPKQEENT